MMYALVGSGKAAARPGLAGLCPGCGAEMVPKCGDINRWHWSHAAGPDCDPWYEPESAWHLRWKALASPCRVEVVMGRHRADIVTTDWIIELQHSSLAPCEVAAREAYYDRMLWLVDASSFRHHLSIRRKTAYVTFRWRWPRKWMNAITRPLYWDFGEGDLLHVKKLHKGAGWGQWADRDEFCGHFESPRFVEAGA